ncbi:MAG: hypothetical protein QOE99_354 [Actinomycetota bacterium]|jgi:hypothetical protein|nr:hypothetical protein [Actinomycetota bacterium]
MPRRRVLLSTISVVAVGATVALSGGASAGASPFAFRTSVLQDQKAYGEPSLAVADDGKHVAVCVPGGAGQTSVWYSGDLGRTFGTSHTTSDNGGGDCEIDFLPNGTLLNADLEVTDSAIRYSKDYGKTWQGSQTAGLEQDRQWFAHSKNGKTAYLVYHDFAAEAELYAQSNDGGLTWTTADAAHPVNNTDQIGAPGAAGTQAPGKSASFLDQGGNTFSGPMLISPDGRDTYVMYSISDLGSNTVGTTTPPYGPTRGIVVAHKGAEDTGFSNKYAVADSDAINGAIFPWGAVDDAGNVYVLYNSDKGSSGHFHTYYVFSTDKAKTWSKPVKVDGAPLAQGAQVYATGDAGAPGVLDIAWYGSDKAAGASDLTAVWDVHFAQVRKATSAHPSISRSLISPNPIHRGDICLNGLLCAAGGDRSLLDFFELQIGPDGMANIAYADNDGFGQHPSTSTRGKLTGAVVKGGRVIFARQSKGASAYQK